jgi:hypothetical protein
MDDRRLVGIDLGIISAHTVRVLAGDGSLVCRGKAIPTVDSLGEVERAALAETPGARCLRWWWNRPARRGCRSRCSSVPAATPWTGSARPKPMTCAGCCRAMPSPTASTPTPWPASRWSTRPGCTRWCCRMRPGRRWTAACGPPIGSPRPPPPTSAASPTWSSSCCRPAHLSASSARPTWPCSSAGGPPCAGGRRPCPAATTAGDRIGRSAGRPPGHPVAGRRPRRPGAVRRPPRHRLAGVGRRGRHRGPAACRHPGRAGRPRHQAGGLLPAGRPGRAGPQPARPGHHRRARSGRHHGPRPAVHNASKFRSFTGLAPKASETGQTDRKGQPITKAGNKLLRTTLHRAADHARRHDPQLARSYWIQMVQRGKDHLGATCVVAAHLAERAWTVMDRGTPYVVCDTDGTPVTPAQAKAIIAEHWTVPEQVRRQRRSRKGKAPQQVLTGHAHGARSATRRPAPSSATLGRQPSRVKLTHPQP